jgi:hypothetical protein
MPFYVVVSRGPTATRSKPILALSDQRVIRLLLALLSEEWKRDDARHHAAARDAKER